jgi:hypothetical protein
MTMSVHRRADWIRVLERRIDGIFKELRARDGELCPPLDLNDLKASFRIVAVEERPMIPEAATEPTSGGFKVYLQDNFSNLPGISARRRFTLAHEFCHTLFYDVSKDAPMRIRGAPSGDAVEKLCHRGAGLLLVPTQLLELELRSLAGRVSAKDVPVLARRFDVSVEVMLRRLQDVAGSSAIDHAIILVGPPAGVTHLHILAALYSPWLFSHFDVPTYGFQFDKWLKGLAGGKEILGRDGFERQVPGGRLVGSSPINVGQNRFLFDLWLQLGEESRQEEFEYGQESRSLAPGAG